MAERRPRFSRNRLTALRGGSFLSNLFSHAPNGKVAEVARMLKAIRFRCTPMSADADAPGSSQFARHYPQSERRGP